MHGFFLINLVLLLMSYIEVIVHKVLYSYLNFFFAHLFFLSFFGSRKSLSSLSNFGTWSQSLEVRWPCGTISVVCRYADKSWTFNRGIIMALHLVTNYFLRVSWRHIEFGTVHCVTGNQRDFIFKNGTTSHRKPLGRQREQNNKVWENGLFWGFFSVFFINQTTVVIWEICFSTFQVMKQPVFAWDTSQSLHTSISPSGAETEKFNLWKCKMLNEASTQKRDLKVKIVPLIVFTDRSQFFLINLSHQYLFFSK